MTTATAVPLLSVRHLKKYYPITGGLLNRVTGQVKAVDDVSFDLREGECFGLVGESGCGKTTVGRVVLRAQEPTAGSVLFRVGESCYDLATLSPRELAPLRRHAQMIFQDPYASLSPRMTVGDTIGEPLLVNGLTGRREREARVHDLLARVGLRPEYATRYPHAFSGGQRQRIAIARALALHPRLIIADEPVSALDVSVQAQVLNLLQDLQAEFGITYLFIAHNLPVVRHLCDRIAVMYLGKIVEIAETEAICAAPRHPYTAALLAAAPVPDPARRAAHPPLTGEVADAAHVPTGCAFHPRCPHADARCRDTAPALREIIVGHQVSCHRAEEIKLSGME